MTPTAEIRDMVDALFDAGATVAKVKLREAGRTWEIEATRAESEPRKEITSGRKRRA